MPEVAIEWSTVWTPTVSGSVPGHHRRRRPRSLFTRAAPSESIRCTRVGVFIIGPDRRLLLHPQCRHVTWTRDVDTWTHVELTTLVAERCRLSWGKNANGNGANIEYRIARYFYPKGCAVGCLKVAEPHAAVGIRRVLMEVCTI